MRPVDQTMFGHTPPHDAGNCLQACIASLLELPLDDVPHFVADGDGWWSALLDWLRCRGFWVAETVDPSPGLGFAGGKSPRGDWGHAVVTDGPDIAHDPHPSRAGLDGAPTEYRYLVQFDPASPS